MDYCFTAAPECIKWYNYYNKLAYFLPEASSTISYKKLNISKKYDVVFIGKKYGNRPNIIKYLEKNGINVYTRGHGWKDGVVSNSESLKIFNQAKIILGIGGILHCTKFNALKLRDFDATLTGSFYMAQYNPDLKLLFNESSELVFWKSKRDLLKKIKYYLKNEDERELIASKSFNRCKKDHLWKKRIDKIIEITENE